jgi:pyruvate formate-lyase activating enzyme-like uncharacterized protein
MNLSYYCNISLQKANKIYIYDRQVAIKIREDAIEITAICEF